MKFIDDNILHVCPKSLYKKNKARWKDGKYYNAKILQYGGKWLLNLFIDVEVQKSELLEQISDHFFLDDKH